MDTLIDNRTFPSEMQQSPEFKGKEKSTPWLLILLIILAVGIITFLLYNIFIKKQDQSIHTSFPTKEKRVQTVKSFKKTVPTMTQKERDDAMYSFFNKQ